nr:TRAP transporter small permease subunit [uncultured Halomonas sp.]
MQQRLQQLSRALERLCRLVAGIFLVLPLLVTIVDVATRYLYRLTEGAFSFTILGSVELVSYSMLFALLAAMAANVEKSQVVVEAFSHNLSDVLKTRLHGIYLLGFTVLGGVLCIGLWDAAHSAAGYGEVTQDLRLPMSPIYYVAAALSLLLALRSLIHAWLSAVHGVPGEFSHGD